MFKSWRLPSAFLRQDGNYCSSDCDLDCVTDLVVDVVAAPQRPQLRQARLTFLVGRLLPLFHRVSEDF